MQRKISRYLLKQMATTQFFFAVLFSFLLHFCSKFCTCLPLNSNKFYISLCLHCSIYGVLRVSVVKCLTCNPEVLGSSLTGSSGLFRGSVHGQDTSEPKPSASETQKNMNNVNGRRDMTEILLKAV